MVGGHTQSEKPASPDKIQPCTALYMHHKTIVCLHDCYKYIHVGCGHRLYISGHNYIF